MYTHKSILDVYIISRHQRVYKCQMTMTDSFIFKLTLLRSNILDYVYQKKKRIILSLN